MEHLVIIQWTEAGNYLAYLPEVPGVAARGDTVEEAERNLGVALDNYLAIRRAEAGVVAEGAREMETADAA